jgi:hypothetical protein
MPKLNSLQLAERIRQRIAQMEADEEIAAKDVRALLTDAQHTELESAWQHQQQLRKGKRATTEAQQNALGWKSKRELRVEAFKQALHELEQNSLATLKDLQHQNQVRQSRIYLDTYFAERDSGASKHQAEGRANNALTRAALARLDRTAVDRVSPRDQQVREMEERLNKQLGLDGDGENGDA